MRIFLCAVLVAARPSGNEASTGAVCFLSNNNANTSCPGRSHFELPWPLEKWPFCSGDTRDTSSKFMMKKPGGDNAGREEEIRKKVSGASVGAGHGGKRPVIFSLGWVSFYHWFNTNQDPYRYSLVIQSIVVPNIHRSLL